MNSLKNLLFVKSDVSSSSNRKTDEKRTDYRPRSQGRPIQMLGHNPPYQASSKNKEVERKVERMDEERDGDQRIQKKVISKPKIDRSKLKLKYIGYPKKLTPSERCRKKYAVQIIFEDQKGKEHKKHVRFGKEGKTDYVDDKDELKRISLVNKLGHTDDILHGNFYRAYLLNSKEDNIHDAYKNLTNNLCI